MWPFQVRRRTQSTTYARLIEIADLFLILSADAIEMESFQRQQMARLISGDELSGAFVRSTVPPCREVAEEAPAFNFSRTWNTVSV